ncbi:CAP64-like protein [Fistulina hepatica ATCC 64428]|uniref:CAP64-like protein n=1 Tax=Fistulina hepatica ATCC 64428 TaxID=1128425 RepID=A0A0D6ZZJ1_9AGAR|nr:CAP64-like protein [Fistulina hepatica ATCC 64428]
MQRRSKTAHISPPRPHSMSTDEKVRRGFTRRIWVIVGVVVFILTLTHYILPSAHPAVSTYTNINLKPKNYFNATDFDLAPNPFQFCPVFGPGDDVAAKYNPVQLAKTRLHLGSGTRVQRVIHRALAGQPVTISVIGGSVSSCHGAGDDPISPRCYPSKFFQWWNSVFPHPASELTNGAMRRVTSDYYGFCAVHHVPDLTDIVIVELDSDDSADAQALEHFELLIRSLLLRPDQPAVIILGNFSPQIGHIYGFNGPDHTHNVVAHFYDVPHLSTKPLFYPDFIRDPTSIMKYFTDPLLANSAGHDVLADVLVSYFQAQVCEAWGVYTGTVYQTAFSSSGDDNEWHGLFGGIGQRKGFPEPGQKKGAEVDRDGNLVDLNALKHGPAASSEQQVAIPHAMISTRPNSGRPFEEIAPYCVSANDLINPLPPSLFYGSGWFANHPAGSNTLHVREHYWHSSMPTSKLRIPIMVGRGDIGIYYLQEPVKEIDQGSTIECWVDDNYKGAKSIRNAADIGDAKPAMQVIDHYVSRGSHFVECKLTGEEGVPVPTFKIIGVFST